MHSQPLGALLVIAEDVASAGRQSEKTTVHPSAQWLEAMAVVQEM